MALPPVYSTRFICVQATNFNGTYTVPSGFRAVVVDVSAYCPSPVTGYYVYLYNVTKSVAHWSSTFPSDNNSAHFAGRVVFEPGEEMQTFGNGPVSSCATVSGYLLSLP